MPTKIYLARHGETLWNKTQRLQGQLDSELTSLGKIQSLDVAIMKYRVSSRQKLIPVVDSAG